MSQDNLQTLILLLASILLIADSYTGWPWLGGERSDDRGAGAGAGAGAAHRRDERFGVT
jgi:hypothetical protein